jgi:hypothetical protein
MQPDNNLDTAILDIQKVLSKLESANSSNKLNSISNVSDDNILAMVNIVASRMNTLDLQTSMNNQIKDCKYQRSNKMSLSYILNTADYPHWVNDLETEYNIFITPDKVLTMAVALGINISNAYCELILSTVRQRIQDEHGYDLIVTYNVNNLDTHLYINTDSVCYKKDIDNIYSTYKSKEDQDN